MARETRRANRSWIWFFVGLAVLSISGIAWEVWANLRQQLTPEALAAARQLWDERRPSAYIVEYSIKRESNPDLAGVAAERYSVTVQNGQVTSASDPEGKPLRPDQYEFGSMDSFFDFIANRMREDAEPSRPRPFVKATFDSSDGHVINYVHSVARTRERLEVSATLKMLVQKPAEPEA